MYSFVQKLLDPSVVNNLSVLIIGLSFISLVISLFRVRNIFYYALRTDNQLITDTATKMKCLGLPSSSHEHGHEKSSMKEMAVWLLAIFTRLFPQGHTYSDRSLVSLCLVMNFASSILFYYIVKFYITPQLAFLSLILYHSIYTNILVALWGGVVHVAQFFSLLGVFFLVLAEKFINQIEIQLLMVFFSGLAFACLLFSSASSRKYILLNLGALLFSCYRIFSPGNLITTGFSLDLIFIPIMLLIAGMLYYLERQAPRIVEKIKAVGEFTLLRKIIIDKNLERYTRILSITLDLGKRAILLLTVYLGFVLYFSPTLQAGYYFSMYLLGVVFGCFFICYPYFIKMITGYYHYSQYGKKNWRSRFFYNLNLIRSHGFDVDEDFRGAGFAWVIKYFFKVAPHHLLFNLSLIILLPILGVNYLVFFAAVLMALSPILIGEFTKGIQLGRPYYPGFLGLNILCVFLIDQISNPEIQTFISLLFILISLILFIRTQFQLQEDIFPARLFLNHLINFLSVNAIMEIWTLDHDYNSSVFRVIESAYPNRYTIHYVVNEREIPSTGYFLLPPTNNKSVLYSDYEFSRSSDPGIDLPDWINKMYIKLNLSDFFCNFKTICSSPYWVDESEVTSYRSFFLKDIKATDFDRGRLKIVSNQILKNNCGCI